MSVKLDNLDQLSYDEIQDIMYYCKEYMREHNDELINKKYDKNEEYVGRCYYLPSIKESDLPPRYIKVMSIRGHSFATVSCLIIPQHVRCEFVPNFHVFAKTHKNEGSFDFDAIEIDSIQANVIKEKGIEITPQEFDKELQGYFEELKAFVWDWRDSDGN